MTVAWRYAVVIPAFNEAASIARVVAKVAALPGPVEVIVVDDGSTDGTAEEIARVQRCLPIVSLRLAGNRGKGAAVRAGIARATAPVVVLHDADLEYDPASLLLALVKPIERDLTDPVCGRRFSWGRWPGNGSDPPLCQLGANVSIEPVHGPAADRHGDRPERFSGS